MWPIIGGLMSGASSLLGSWFSSDTSAKNTQAQIQAQQQMQKETMEFNAQQAGLSREFSAQEAEVNRRYQTQMSNTAFQRSRQDAEATGLNPMVLAGMGGASTPSGSMASSSSASVGTPTVPQPQTTHPLGKIGEAVGSAVNTAITMKTMDKLQEEIANLAATRALTTATEDLRTQELATEKHETLRRANVAALEGFKMPGARFSAKQAEDLLSMPDWLRSTVVQGGFVGGKASDALGPITDLISSARGVKSLLPHKRSGTSTKYDREGNEVGGSSFEERYGAAFGR